MDMNVCVSCMSRLSFVAAFEGQGMYRQRYGTDISNVGVNSPLAEVLQDVDGLADSAQAMSKDKSISIFAWGTYAAVSCLVWNIWGKKPI